MIPEEKLSTILLKAFERRQRLYGDPNNNSFRLFNALGDGMNGLTVDLYNEYILVQFYFKELYDRKNDILQAIEKGMQNIPYGVKGMLLKNRLKSGPKDDYIKSRSSDLIIGNNPPREYMVKHNGINALVNLNDGQNTGLFLDMREVRDKLKGIYGSTDSMLNLFCYTAVFSIHALKNGAKYAVNIDLSKPVLRHALKNYEVNGLSGDDRDFINGDCFEWIRILKKNGRRFKLVIFDPPTFSRNKRKTFSIKRDYKKSLDLISNIADGGYVLTSINAESLSMEEYISFHPDGWEMVFFSNESSDFVYRRMPYLKAGLWRVKV